MDVERCDLRIAEKRSERRNVVSSEFTEKVSGEAQIFCGLC